MKKLKISVLICESNKTYRELLVKMLSKFLESIKVEGVFPDFDRAVLSKEIIKADYFIIHFDRTIKEPNKIISQFKSKHPEIKLIILTFSDNPLYHKHLIRSGAFGVYEINSPIERLVDLITASSDTAE